MGDDISSSSDDDDFIAVAAKKAKIAMLKASPRQNWASINKTEQSSIQDVDHLVELNSSDGNISSPPSDFEIECPKLRGKMKKKRKVNRKNGTNNILKRLNKIKSRNDKNDLNESLNMNDSLEIVEYKQEDYRFTLKFQYKQIIDKVEVQKHETLDVLFKKISAKLGLNRKDLKFYDNLQVELNGIKSASDYNLTIGSFVQVRNVLQSQINQVALKLQAQNKKSSMEISINANDPLQLALKKFADAQKLAVKDLKLFFDGELVALDDTPIDLEFEGGECLDVYQQPKSIPQERKTRSSRRKRK